MKAQQSVPEVFPEWHNRDVDEVLYQCRELLEDMTFPTVQRWRAAGGKVVGHFQVYFPEEIVHAAGALPFKVRGAPVEPMQADSRFGSYLCSILKTSLELVLSDRIEMEMFVTHPICDAARNLAAVWGRNTYDRLRRSVEEVTGATITDDRLRASVALFNENRALLRELYVVKRESPWQISAEDAYALVAVGGMIPREEHNALLRHILPLIRQRGLKAQDRIRVVFEGGFCEQPPLDLIRAIGRSCYVVDDDFLIGLRWLVDDVAVNGNPLESLAGAYLEQSSYSPVQHDLRKPKERMLLERIERSGATAAIVTAAKMCEPGLEEQVTYTRALDEAGVPYFVSEFEENMTSFDHLEIQLETFVENLLFD